MADQRLGSLLRGCVGVVVQQPDTGAVLQLAQQGGQREVHLALPFTDQGDFLHLNRLHRLTEHGEQRFQFLEQEQAFGVIPRALERLHQFLQTLRLGASLLNDCGRLALGIRHHRFAFGFSRSDHVRLQLLHHLFDPFLLNR